MARRLNFPFTLTDARKIICTAAAILKRRSGGCQAYQEAGADVLYAPGLTSKDEIATLVRSVDRPVNVLVGIPGAPLNMADLSALGVRRIAWAVVWLAPPTAPC